MSITDGAKIGSFLQTSKLFRQKSTQKNTQLEAEKSILLHATVLQLEIPYPPKIKSIFNIYIYINIYINIISFLGTGVVDFLTVAP